MKPLIVYYSYTNTNTLLANAFQDRWQCDSVRLEERFKRTTFGFIIDGIIKRRTSIKPLEIEWDQYDFVLFVAPIWMGRIPPALRTFLHKYKDQLPDYGFASLCGLRSNDKVPQELTQSIGHPPVAFLQMLVHEFLPADQKENLWPGYRLTEEDLTHWEDAISGFEQEIRFTNSRISNQKSLHLG